MAYHLTVRTFLMPDLDHPIRRGDAHFARGSPGNCVAVQVNKTL